MNNFQHVVKGGYIHLLLSADILKDFYEVDDRHETDVRPVIQQVSSTDGVPVVYYTLGKLVNNPGILQETPDISDIIAMSHNSGKLNHNKKFLTYIGMLYNPTVSDFIERVDNCLLIPVVSVCWTKKITYEETHIPAKLGSRITRNGSDTDEWQYCLQSLIILDLNIPDNTSVLPAELETILAIQDINEKRAALVTYLIEQQPTPVKVTQPVITHTKRQTDKQS